MQPHVKSVIINKYFSIETAIKIVNGETSVISKVRTMRHKLYEMLKVEPTFMGIGIDVKKLITVLKEE